MKSEAQKRATAKYNTKKYDKITFRVLKGQKVEIEQMAKAEGKSLNAYITERLFVK